MTDDQKKILVGLDTKVHQLMLMYDNLKLENKKLTEQLASKDVTIQNGLNEIELLRAKYDNLKFAKMIAFQQSDLSEAKKRLSRLVREVDKCIASMNE